MRILIGSCLALLLGGNLLAAEPTIPADLEIITFQSKVGKATFKHKMHADMTITECTTCHHTNKDGEPIKPCRDCHVKKKKEDTPSVQKAFHLRCQGCHQYTVEHGGHAGPLKKQCKLCHIKPKKK